MLHACVAFHELVLTPCSNQEHVKQFGWVADMNKPGECVIIPSGMIVMSLCASTAVSLRWGIHWGGDDDIGRILASLTELSVSYPAVVQGDYLDLKDVLSRTT